ncbi:kinase [Montanilutibacter psychrotolerans]|uniref:kinase n=1 Tax=Montanilutibacter psychrotolerans TaxID=1327343 RepID=UPI001CC20B2C|nr:kinase [Lysobacter psychrotolerans]
MTPHLHPAATGNAFASALVVRALDQALHHGGRVHAIAGMQGSGKSTLAGQMVGLARQRGLRAVALSIDDFYLGRRERHRLARAVHPLLAMRGPPGTHDVALACEVLDALRAGGCVRVPRFDKLADTRLPPSRWTRVEAVDLVVFEGWFLKTPAQSPDELREPINPLERDEDADGHWRRHCNAALARDYPALWARLDSLLLLRAPGFDVVPGWRWQQEQGLLAARPGRTAMTRAQVDRFVQLFERVSRQALRALPDIAQWSWQQDAQRRVR